jgi:hypothetical protein
MQIEINVTSIAATTGVILGVYGAVLSTLNLINQRRAAIPQLKVILREIHTIDVPSGRVSDLRLVVDAANYGQKICTIEMLGFEFGGSTPVQVPQPEGDVMFPHEVKPETSATMYFSPKALAKNIHDQELSGNVKVVACVIDAVRRQYRSQPITFDSDKYFEKSLE